MCKVDTPTINEIDHVLHIFREEYVNPPKVLYIGSNKLHSLVHEVNPVYWTADQKMESYWGLRIVPLRDDNYVGVGI